MKFRDILKKTTTVIFLFSSFFSYAKNSDEWPVTPIKEGNFSLPFSQQPGPLVGFGQSILDAGDIQLNLFSQNYIGEKNFYSLLEPSLLYGITDVFSILVAMPMSPYMYDGTNASSKLEEVYVQFEYAFLDAYTKTSNDYASIMANVSIPTGSEPIDPVLDLGSTSIFLAATYSRTMINWYFFISPGITLTTNWSGGNLGNEFLYQGGLGRTITSIPDKFIFAWLVELDGVYTMQKGNNSSENIIYVTPSVDFSFQNFIFQIGVGYPIVQNINTKTTKREFISIDGNIIFTL